MAKLTDLKPYIDQGMVAEICLDNDIPPLRIWKNIVPENEEEFSGFYIYKGHDPFKKERIGGCDGMWTTLKGVLETKLVQNPNWKLDPSYTQEEKWSWR